MTQTSRNQPCPCGSGKRYKHCCGVHPATVVATPAAGVPLREGVSAAERAAMRPDLSTLMQRALVCQKDGKLAAAEALYREALALDPLNFDALHMLGVVRLQLDDPEDGARLILAAIRAARVEFPPIYANLALCLVAIARQRGYFEVSTESGLPAVGHPRLHFADDVAAFAAEAPLVSVLMPRVTGGRGVADSLRSLARQTCRNLELVLGDETQGDQSPGGTAALLAGCAIPIRHVPRENLTAAPTLNDCVGHARGRYVTPLQPGDEFEADRFELMARLLCESGGRWGFSGVRFLDHQGRPLGYGDAAGADALMRGLDAIHEARSITAAFLQFNHAIAAGNLLVERRLWDELGGFRDDHPAPCWDFCVRATLVAAPAILFEPKYIHRLRGAGESGESGVAAAADTGRLQAQWRDAIAQRLKDRPHAVRQIFVAQYAREWRLLESGRAGDLEPRTLVETAQSLLAVPDLAR